MTGAKVTHGLGAGSDPDVGRQAALEDTEKIIEILEGARASTSDDGRIANPGHRRPGLPPPRIAACPSMVDLSVPRSRTSATLPIRSNRPPRPDGALYPWLPSAFGRVWIITGQ